MDVLVQEDPEPTIESGDIKQGVVEVLGLVLHGGQDLHHQLVWDVVAVDKEGRPIVVKLDQAHLAPGVEQSVPLEGDRGSRYRGLLRGPDGPTPAPPSPSPRCRRTRGMSRLVGTDASLLPQG